MREELDILIPLLKEFEGCHLKAYYCPAGVLTIGWGATGAGIYPHTRWTQEKADARLEKDARYFLAAVKNLLGQQPIGVHCACASFAFNLGIGRLKTSTLRRKILRGDYEGAKKEFMRWIYAGGKKMRGLERRRRAEIALF